MAESDVDDFNGHLEDFETLPCSCTYVVVCIVLPFVSGQLNSVLSAGFTLHFEDMGWPIASAGAAFSIGFVIRVLVQQIVLRAGYWIAVPLCMVHLTFVVLALIYSTSLWAVLAQLVVWGLDPSCAIEGIAFDCFGASEVQARQASSTTLSVSTISVALSCTIGGFLYNTTGWTGVTAYYCAFEGLLVLLLSLQPACRKSFMQVFFPQKDPDVEAAEDQKETTGEAVFKQVVPGTTQAMQLPGATEQLHLEDMEDENPKRASSLRKSQMSRKSDQSEMHSSYTAKARHSSRSNPATPTRSRDLSSQRSSQRSNSPPRRPSSRSDFSARRSRKSLKSNHSARHRWRVSSHSAARRSGRSKQSDQTEQSGVTILTAITRQSVFSAITKLTALSQAGEDFRHHFGTSTGLQPQIVGATGQQSVLRLQIEDEDGHAKEPAKAGMSAIPKDVRFPAFLLALCSFCNVSAYSIEFATYAIYFKQVHNWNDATLAGVAQTAGDLTAAVAMQAIPFFFRGQYDPDEAGCLRRFFHHLTSQPYNVSFALATWVIFHIGLCCPVLAVAIVAQIFMGTTFVYNSKWISDMNTFYSMGDPTVFLSLQVVSRNAESIGGAIACGAGVALYTVHPLLPYAFAAAMSGATFLLYTVGFCARLGLGDDIETAEDKRARRKGVRRVSSWAADARKSNVGLSGVAEETQ